MQYLRYSSEVARFSLHTSSLLLIIEGTTVVVQKILGLKYRCRWRDDHNAIILVKVKTFRWCCEKFQTCAFSGFVIAVWLSNFCLSYKIEVGAFNKKRRQR